DIIDYYFPETKDKDRTNLYFDFDSVLEPIMSRTADKVELIVPPLGKLYGNKYVIDGEFNRVRLRNYVRRQANKYYMHGYTELLEDDKVVIVVASINNENLIKFEKNLNNEFILSQFNKSTWNKPLRIGFETREKLKLTKRETKQLLLEKEQLISEN